MTSINLISCSKEKIKVVRKRKPAVNVEARAPIVCEVASLPVLLCSSVYFSVLLFMDLLQVEVEQLLC